jgi:hypothetical protein
MVDVDNLTDAELRSKLIEFGFPVMPITGTTRKTMTKKLKMLLENKSKISKENRRSLGRYSSEDESDSDAKSAKRDKYKRATMAAPLMQPPQVRKRPSKVEPTVVEPPPVRGVELEDGGSPEVQTQSEEPGEGDFGHPERVRDREAGLPGDDQEAGPEHQVAVAGCGEDGEYHEEGVQLQVGAVNPVCGTAGSTMYLLVWCGKPYRRCCIFI